MKPVIAIPLKPFGVAKARLAPILSAAQRSRVGKAVAAHTVEAAVKTGASTAVVTADHGVAAWARHRGVEVIYEVPELGTGLNGAARAAAAHAAGLNRPWIVLHADLPLLESSHLAGPIAALVTGRPVLAPSYDGGTTLLGSTGSTFEFSYGAGSFHRHLAAAGTDALVVTATGLMLDLDDPRDLLAAQDGRDWLSPEL